MLYNLEMIKNLGYDNIDDFVENFIKQHKDSKSLFVGWQSDDCVYVDYDYYSQTGVPNIGVIMTEQQRREEAIKYIMSCLEDGYLDLGLHDQDELEVIKEAIELLIAVEKFNSLPTVNPISADDLRKALERSMNG